MATAYIKRDEALSFPWANGKYDHENANEHFIYGCETYKEWLETLPAVEPKWVNAEEYRDAIIKTLYAHRMQMDESYDDSDFALGYAEAFKIVCMMPLPEPPKEVTDDA